MKICVIGPSRFPLREPFAGGLEAHTHALVRTLAARGHRVTLFAAPGSDPALRARPLDVAPLVLSDDARRDVAAPPEWWMREQHAYLGVMLELVRHGHGLDVVHNNSLHHMPIAMASALSVPVVTTLHTPPLPWLESAVTLAGDASRFVAVSDSTRERWAHAVDAQVVHNGVDPAVWRMGPGGTRAVWTGRMVPEKAPHEAVLAALGAGLAIDLVGPVGDASYVEEHVAPLLSERVRYLGHLPQAQVREVVAHARVALVTPVWEEPFGLVAAEAAMTGTPVAAYARGGLPEIVTRRVGALAPPGDVDALSRVILLAAGLDRRAVRAEAVRRWGLDEMVSRYEQVYQDAAGLRAA